MASKAAQIAANILAGVVMLFLTVFAVAFAISIVVVVYNVATGQGEDEKTATLVTPPEVALATNTFSKYGFSFEYPKEFTATEYGALENEANDTSGAVQVGPANEEGMFLTIVWAKTVTLLDDYLEESLDGGFQGLEEAVASVDRGERVESDFEGQQMLYQTFTFTDFEGEEAHGLLAALDCEDSQKLISFNLVNPTISTNQDILQDFHSFLDSFVC